MLPFAPVRALLLVCALTVAGASALRAGELATWQPGTVGLRDTLVPARGLHVQLRYEQYRGHVVRDAGGGRLGDVVIDLPVVGQTSLELAVDLDLVRIRPAAVLVPLDLGDEALGLRFGVAVAPTLSNGTLSIGIDPSGLLPTKYLQEASLGLGDLQVTPALLGLRLARLELSASYSVNFGVGRYSFGRVSNRGQGFDSHQLQATAALSLDPNRMGALVARGTWELPRRQEETGIRPGQRLTVELGYAQDVVEYEGLLLGVGLGVAHQRQLEHDRTRRRPRFAATRSKDEVNAVSVELRGKYVPYDLTGTLVLGYELGAESRVEGYRVSFGVSFALPILQRTPPPVR